MKSPPFEEIEMKTETAEQERHLLKSIFEVTQNPLFILNRKGEFIKVNPKGMEILGYTWEEFHQMVFLDIVAPEELNGIREKFEEMGQGKEIRFIAHLINRSGEQIPFEMFGTIRGEVCFFILSDIQEKIKMEEELARAKKEFSEKVREKDQYVRELQVVRDLYKEKLKEIEKLREETELLAHVDDLTGLYNHRFFIQQLTMEVERLKRYPTPLSLLMIDVDYFKHYNDNNGHLAGDHALKAIAHIIENSARQTDIVARYGGEEFSVILINTGKEGAKEIAERVRSHVADTRFPNESAQPNENLTVSIGVATYSGPISTLTELIRAADNALYEAKKAGRDRVME
jgi:diguanylate cyclase (GGDEF)-like protein/PAS domain S-box-containing protein